MKALEYGLNNCPEKVLPASSLEKLGDGFHGEAYLIPESNQVIKYSLLYQSMVTDFLLQDFFSRLEKVCVFQKQNNYPCFVKIIDFKFITYGFGGTGVGEDLLFYQTTMERLNLISADEKKLFKTIVRQHRDVKASWQKIIKDVREQSHWLDFDLEKVVSFIYLLEDAPIEHDDMSSSNILKDNNGNFKLIDLDFSRLKD